MTESNIEKIQYIKMNRPSYNSLVRLAAAAGCLLLVLSACGGGEDGPMYSTEPVYSISGTLTGLNPGGRVTLLNNSTDALQLAGNGQFAFPTTVKSSAKYVVTVGAQPTGQKCSVANGAGTASTDVSNVTVSCANNPLVVTTWAGSGQEGSTDGMGVAASFKRPQDIAADAAGNVYVADGGNGRVRKISPSGEVSTIPVSTFQTPTGVAVDAQGTVYVADAGRILFSRFRLAARYLPSGRQAHSRAPMA